MKSYFSLVLLALLSILGSHVYAYEFDDVEEEFDELEEEEIDHDLFMNCYRSEKLNLSNFFLAGTSARKTSQKIVFHNLLRILYGNQPLFCLARVYN